MDRFSLLISGALIGLSIAAPVGPMALLCINRTLSGGVGAGISTGIGASTVQVGYGAVVLLGLHEVAPWLNGSHDLLSLAAGFLMLTFAWRLLRARREAVAGGRASSNSLLLAYVTAVLFNVVNPMLVVLLMGSVASVLGPKPPTEAETGLLLAGLFVGSVAWWVCLSSVTAVLHGRLGPGVMERINKGAAVVLVGFGLTALVRAIRG